MQSISDQRGYFENSLAEKHHKRKNFRSGLSIHDIFQTRRNERDRVSGNAGTWRQPPVLDGRALCLCFGALRRLYRSLPVHRRPPGDHQTSHRVEVVAAGHEPRGGEVSNTPKGKRYALHHMIVAGKLGYGAWRDGGFTIHDVTDAAQPKLLSHIKLVAAISRRHAPPLPLPGRNPRWWRMRRTRRSVPKGVPDLRDRCAGTGNPVTISTMPGRMIVTMHRPRHLRSAQST